RLMHEQLSNSRDRYRNLFDNAPVGLVTIDTHGFLTDVNQTLCQWLGYEKNQLIGEHLNIFTNGKYQHSFFLHCRDVINSGNNSDMDIALNTRSGELLEVRINSFPTHDSMGEFSLCLCGITDISRLKSNQTNLVMLTAQLEEKVSSRTQKLEELMAGLREEVSRRTIAEEKLSRSKDEIVRAWQKEKELNAMKSRFISMISHEYRTPLTVIMTASELMESLYEECNSEEFRRKNKMIKNAVSTMTRLLENVLMVGRIESDLLEINNIKVDLNKLCRGIIDEISPKAKSDRKIILKQQKPEMIISTDPELLRTALSNILMNAVIYSAAGSPIYIILKQKRKICSITIENEGIGVEPHESESIFEPFIRGSNIGAIEGTGLGLSIAKGCIDTLDGSISVDSIPGDGAKFTVVLPCK
ncbi:MAG: ATP-binding protein, partial [Candidatus Kapaibacterium sp.]